MRARRLVAAAVMVGGAPLAACSSDDAASVPTQRVRSGTLDETVRVPARLESARVLSTSTPAPGTVAELFVDNGDEVVAGQPIMRIESPLIDQLMAQAGRGAGNSSACASLRRAPAKAPAADAGLEQVQNAFRQVLASVAKAQQALQEAVPPAPGAPDLPALPALPEPPPLPDLTLPAPPALPALPAVPSLGDVPTPEVVAGLVRGELDGARAQLDTSRRALEKASAELSSGAVGATLALDAALTSTRASIAAAQRSAEEAQRNARTLLESFVCRSSPERTTILEDIKERLVVRAPAAGVVVFGAPPSSGPSLPSLGGGAESILGDLGSMFAGSSASQLFTGSEVGLAQTLFTVYDLEHFVAVADLDEGQLADVFAGARASVSIESVDERREGVVTFVSPVRTGGSEQPVFRAEVTLDAPADDQTVAVSTADRPTRRLAVGMTAQMDIHLRSVGPSTIVPEGALLRDDDSTYVYVVDDGRARARKVRVLGTNGTDAAVEAKAVATGARVVLAPRTVDDGDSVST